MARDPSDKIKECLSRAAELRKLASAASDPASKFDFRGLELQWLDIAESYKLVERSNRFLTDARARRIAPNHGPVPTRRETNELFAAKTGAPLADLLGVLVHTATEYTRRNARAAF